MIIFCLEKQILCLICLYHQTEAPLKTTKTPVTRPPAPPPSTQGNNVQNEKNYLEMAADVNFNGGINRHMDELKRLYPGGHWPDQDGDSDEVPSGGQVQESGSPSKAVEFEGFYIDEEDENENDEEENPQDIAVINIKQHFGSGETVRNE